MASIALLHQVCRHLPTREKCYVAQLVGEEARILRHGQVDAWVPISELELLPRVSYHHAEIEWQEMRKKREAA